MPIVITGNSQNEKLQHNVHCPVSRRVVLALLCIYFLFLPGCQRRDEVIAGVAIPVPSQMKKIPDKMFDPIPGFEEGQASFQGKVSPGEIFAFYQENLAARGWKPDARLGGGEGSLAYTNGTKGILIRYDKNDDGTTNLIITVGTARLP